MGKNLSNLLPSSCHVSDVEKQFMARVKIKGHGYEIAKVRRMEQEVVLSAGAKRKILGKEKYQ